MGYEAYRELVFERQKQLGIVTDKAELSPINPYIDEKSDDGKGWPELDTVRPWDSLSDDEKRLFCRMAEVYAGFLSHADHEIGRLLDHLEESGELDNTMIVLVSDNGASGEGGPNGSVNENKIFNGLPDQIEENLPFLDELGSPRTYNHYSDRLGVRVQHAVQALEAVRELGGRHRRPDDRLLAGGDHEAGHRAGSTRTRSTSSRRSTSASGIEPPEVVKGYTQFPIEGVSFAADLRRPGAPRPPSRRSSTRWAARGRSGTRAGRPPRSRPRRPTCWADYATQRWELFDTENDPSECHDLAAEHPEKLQELIGLWWHEAGRYGALPLENRERRRDPHAPNGRSSSKPRNRYIYYPGGSEIPESVAPNIRNRSYTIAVEATIDTEEAGGVLFAQGSRFGGHALYLKDGKLKYVYNFVGLRSRSSSRPSRSRPATSCCRPRSRGTETPCRPRARSPSTSATRRSARAGSRPSRASSRSRAKGSTSARTAPSRSPTTIRARTRGRLSAARSSGRRSTSAATPFVDLATEAQAAFARD